MPYCSKCGKQMAEGGKFCISCGHRVESLTPEKEEYNCPGCGTSLRYIDQYQQWWCDNCQTYPTPTQKYPQAEELTSKKIDETNIDFSNANWKKCAPREGHISFKCPNCNAPNYLQLALLFSPSSGQGPGLVKAEKKADVPYPGVKVLAVIIGAIAAILVSGLLIFLTGLCCISGLVFIGITALVYGVIVSTLSKGYPVWLYECNRCHAKIFIASDGNKTLVDGHLTG